MLHNIALEFLIHSSSKLNSRQWKKHVKKVEQTPKEWETFNDEHTFFIWPFWDHIQTHSAQRFNKTWSGIIYLHSCKTSTMRWEFCIAFRKIPNCLNVDCVNFVAFWTLSYCNRTFLFPFPLFYTIKNTIKPILQEIIRTFP